MLGTAFITHCPVAQLRLRRWFRHGNTKVEWFKNYLFQYDKLMRFKNRYVFKENPFRFSLSRVSVVVRLTVSRITKRFGRFFIRVRDASVRLWIIFSLPAVLPLWLCLALETLERIIFSLTYCIIADFRCVYSCWYFPVMFFCLTSVIYHVINLSPVHLYLHSACLWSTIPIFFLREVKTFDDSRKSNYFSIKLLLERKEHSQKLLATDKTFNYWRVE